MGCNKTYGSDDLASESYKTFWSELRNSLLLSYGTFLSGKLSLFQNQVYVKVIDLKKVIKVWPKTGDQFLYLTLIQNLFLKF